MNNKKNIKRVYNIVIIALMVLALGYVCSRFIHWGNVEYTDDAQVWRHITPLNARVGGFIEEARVNMENARADYERFEALLQKDAVTRQQYDNARARYEAARARYEQATASRQSTALVHGEQAQRLNQNTAGVSVAEAQVNLARLNLSYTVVVATCDQHAHVPRLRTRRGAAVDLSALRVLLPTVGQRLFCAECADDGRVVADA